MDSSLAKRRPPLAALSLGLRRPFRFGLRIADGLGQHLAELGLGFRGFPRRFWPLGHDAYMGTTEGKLNPQRADSTAACQGAYFMSAFDRSATISDIAPCR